MGSSSPNKASPRQAKDPIPAADQASKVLKMNYIYILTNKYNKVLYIGVTSNLIKRIFEHKSKTDLKSFTAKYNLNKLVYYESSEDIVSAIEREKYLKHKTRNSKIQLIQNMNPNFKDLHPLIVL